MSIVSKLLLMIILNLPLAVFADNARWTFDGHIHNNSLAISPNEKVAVVSLSDTPEVIVYDLDTKKVRNKL